MDGVQTALLQLGRRLRAAGYHFITPTPETHRRVLARPYDAADASLSDIFGWNRPFSASALPADLAELLRAADCMESYTDERLRSAVRFSTLGRQLFVHSAFPTDAADAVFFGPDTYRFVRAVTEISRSDPGFVPETVVDIGAGTGAGGLSCSTLYPQASIILSDINRSALRFAEINARLDDMHNVQLVESDVLAGIMGTVDLVIANPPYLVDPGRRTYRHGGGTWGCDLAKRIVDESLPRLGPQGKLLLYTGTPVVRGIDKFLDAVWPILERHTRSYRYEEIDPDVFGEELSNSPYDGADRIAVVMLLVDAKDLRR